MPSIGSGILPSGQFGTTRLLRGTFKEEGRFGGTTFTWLPNWDKTTVKVIRPSGREVSQNVYDVVVRSMQRYSRRAPGGGVRDEDDGWSVSVGSPPATHTHWHLIEFGGGRHFAKAPVRSTLHRFGNFKPAGRS